MDSSETPGYGNFGRAKEHLEALKLTHIVKAEDEEILLRLLAHYYSIDVPEHASIYWDVRVKPALHTCQSREAPPITAPTETETSPA